jgi:hypothetical protein
VAIRETNHGYEKVIVGYERKWNNFRKHYKSFDYVLIGNNKIDFVNYFNDHKDELVMGRSNIANALRKIKRDENYIRPYGRF